MSKIKPPFSYFGSKRQVTDIIWKGLGEVTNYVEPFAGSLSILLQAPKIPKIETVNDINCFLTNWWRSVAANPEEVIKYADFPVHETELHARHQWLVSSLTDDFKKKMNDDPDYFDAKIAGYWVWGMGASIGNNWTSSKGLKSMPLLSSAGGGIHGLTYNLQEQFSLLQTRLRRVRVSCGDYSRILTPSILYNNKGLGSKDITGVVLDPPYSQKNRDKVYQDDNDVFKEVSKWAIENDDNSKLRIVLCGYEGDVEMPNTWQTYSWNGSGLGNMGDSRGKDNLSRERIWLSPSCLKI